MKTVILLICILASTAVNAQQTVEGSVADAKGNPLVGANIYIKGTYDGTISDAEGNFRVHYSVAFEAILVISFIGYEQQEILITGKEESQNIILRKETNPLDEVRISAGAFEASEENRAVLLDPIEIATTASSDGDIYGALATFPGAQKQGESGELIVRGGEAHETKTYIDGLLVSSPYSSTMPNLPARGRFSPFMFNGVMFSTGGYSAEYGQALSSVLELQTPGIFDEDITSISLLNVGVGASVTRKNTRSAYSGELAYNNTWPYFFMASHDLNWIEVPQSISSNLLHRQKIGKTGMIKTDAMLNFSNSVLDYSKYNYGIDKLGLKNENEFIKSTYNTELGENTLLKTGIAYNRNVDKTTIDEAKLNENLSTAHLKVALVHYLNRKVTIKGGTDGNYQNYRFNYLAAQDSIDVDMEFEDWILAAYLESDIQIHKNLALRLGTRSEYSSYTQKSDVAPRLSMAFKASKHSQFYFAWGLFYQQAGHDYLKYSKQLDFENARHFLLNYQFQKGKRMFRTEVYHKKYAGLVSYTPGSLAEYENLNNTGDGYARGIDIFWKDDETFKRTSYWLSYSFIDSERKYRAYPQAATPGFLSEHNFSAVYKYWWELITTQFSLTYSFASGRIYYNPENENFMSDRTPAIHDLSGNLSYITDLFGWFTVVHFSVSNILGQERIFSYSYAEDPNQTGNFIASPVTNHIRRTFIIGVFISID